MSEITPAFTNLHFISALVCVNTIIVGCYQILHNRRTVLLTIDRKITSLQPRCSCQNAHSDQRSPNHCLGSFHLLLSASQELRMIVVLRMLYWRSFCLAPTCGHLPRKRKQNLKWADDCSTDKRQWKVLLRLYCCLAKVTGWYIISMFLLAVWMQAGKIS